MQKRYVINYGKEKTNDRCNANRTVSGDDAKNKKIKKNSRELIM